MKRVYFVEAHEGDGLGVAVIADNVTKAKQLSRGEIDCDWIYLRATLCRDVNNKPIVPPEKLKVGHIFEPMEGLKLGVYSWIEYENCPVCKQDVVELRRQDDGSIMCDTCWESKKNHEQ